MTFEVERCARENEFDIELVFTSARGLAPSRRTSSLPRRRAKGTKHSATEVVPLRERLRWLEPEVEGEPRSTRACPW
jgi:hypothetical protein